ncbi:hypothetical protein QBC47DRAFT_395201 [Echria macrotheca]|uniref:Uncharacterized protein n=1 Tax=Echria macrotheca TaxID=438768 RepID=A0AAJ0B492_9PEZI|nr:hypothetical protein QBC47DRAFT_395201 [Echria macrotheca]
MTRPLLPSRTAIAFTVLHGLSVAGCLVAIVAASYSAATNTKSAIATTGAFIAAFLALAVSIVEILGFSAVRRIKRCPLGYLWLLELSTAVVAYGAPAASVLGWEMKEYERCRYDDSEWWGCGDMTSSMDPGMMAAVGGLYLAGTIHAILFVVTAVQSCLLRWKGTKINTNRGEEGENTGIPDTTGPSAVLAVPPKALVRS